MDATTTTRPRSRGRAVRALAVSGAGALLLAALPGVASAEGGGGRTWDVHPGQSIQAAVDAAASGDTIRIAPGTYTEAVCIEDKGLTIQGAGRERTVIRWDRATTNAQIAQRACWDLTDAADEEDAPGVADNVSALFFLNPDKPVTVRDLQTVDHTANGISAWNANGFTVTGTKGVGHDRYGIIAGNSRNIHIVGNVEQGVDRAGTGQAPDAGTAGISVGDSADSRSFIAANRVRGYNLGIFLRESSGGRVDANHLSGNCIGILTFDDAATEIPGSPANVEGGDWRITANVSTANNRWCLQGRAGDQRISGVGMAVVNAANVKLTANVIRDNVPTLPPAQFIPPMAPALTFPSAGLTLLTFAPPPGTDPNPNDDIPGLLTDIRVVGNWFGDNKAYVPGQGAPTRVQMDVFRGAPTPNTPFGPTGPIDFRGNRCDASIPPEWCGAPYPS
ncbi:right-handed parallel beta-helix repeat-containing protein [Geodermatophilus sp. FMUSA9-8]|uniref:right-handed parallel beta-helix repeat-containing protein n=1 Tax=Geodermatophilus sp. FMUSA9-8 TaxID=3120155 RepID=UPI003009B4FC